MLHESNYLAVCNAKATPHPKCEIKCSTDAECYEPSNPLRVCVKGSCVDPGCETDEECKLMLWDSMAGLKGARAVCREKKAS
jgi:hypothetical protein